MLNILLKRDNIGKLAKNIEDTSKIFLILFRR